MNRKGAKIAKSIAVFIKQGPGEAHCARPLLD